MGDEIGYLNIYRAAGNAQRLFAIEAAGCLKHSFFFIITVRYFLEVVCTNFGILLTDRYSWDLIYHIFPLKPPPPADIDVNAS